MKYLLASVFAFGMAGAAIAQDEVAPEDTPLTQESSEGVDEGTGVSDEPADADGSEDALSTDENQNEARQDEASEVTVVEFSDQDENRYDDVITSVDQDTIRFVAESLDHSVRNDLSEKIGVVAAYTSENGELELVYAMQGKFCEDSAECLGLEVFVIFDGEFDAEYANDINQRWSAIKATATEGSLYLTRYLILDNGQTIGNIRTNVLNTLAIAERVSAEGEKSSSDALVEDPPPSVDDIDFGDDSGDYAKDGVCDDARFQSDGDDWTYQREHVLRDATDCQALYAADELTLFLDFGDNSGERANDSACDDIRFEGEGRSSETEDSHVKKDATDCVVAYRARRLNRP